jgi:hemerythrin-like domain-containing protein
MTLALRMLQAEHDLMLRGVEAADHAAARLERGEAVSPAMVSALMQFFSSVVHHSHRDKEEGLLFPALEEKGLSGPQECVAVVIADHQEGVAAFEEMSRAADAYCAVAPRAPAPSTGVRWARSAQQYAAAVRRHVNREEQVLFGKAKQLLTPKELESLAREFERIDERARRAGLAEVLEAFERTARELRPVRA